MGRKAAGRSKGTGTLIQRGRTYLARWIVDGKVHYRSTGESTREAAAKRLAEFTAYNAIKDDAKRITALKVELEGRATELRTYESEHATALASAFDLYRASTSRPNLAASDTLDRYEAQYGHFVAWVKENHPDVVRMNQIDTDIAEAYITAMRSAWSANSYNKRVTLFRTIWDHLKDKARLTDNPWKRMKKLASDPHSRRELTAEELIHVCEPLTGEMRVLFAVGIYTGLRLGDAVTLDWGKVDLLRRQIRITPSKTAKHAHGKVTVIPMNDTLVAMLGEIDGKRSGYIMPDLAAVYERDAADLSKRIQRVFAAAGIKTHGEAYANGRATIEVGFHSLRHTFVSLSANAGVPLALVQSIVGHSNPAMTRHYFHEDEAALANAVAVLPDVLNVSGPDGATASPSVAVSVRLPADLHARLEATAKAKRTTIDKIVTDALAAYLDGAKPSHKTKPTTR